MGKLEEIVFKLIDKEISGVDIYHKSGSMWLIFTDKKKWVVEYTDSNILWYNFSFFNYVLSLVGLSDEKEKYVKKWFESKFIFKPKIEEIHHVDVMKFFNNKMNDTIQNGVKHIKKSNSPKFFSIDDTIQNGVKDTKLKSGNQTGKVYDTIQNGIKEIKSDDGYTNYFRQQYKADTTIQDGVKHILGNTRSCLYQVEDAIQNGVKSIQVNHYSKNFRVEGIIQDGVKCNLLQNYLESKIKIVS